MMGRSRFRGAGIVAAASQGTQTGSAPPSRHIADGPAPQPHIPALSATDASAPSLLFFYTCASCSRCAPPVREAGQVSPLQLVLSLRACLHAREPPLYGLVKGLVVAQLCAGRAGGREGARGGGREGGRGRAAQQAREGVCARLIPQGRARGVGGGCGPRVCGAVARAQPCHTRTAVCNAHPSHLSHGLTHSWRPPP